MRGTTHATLLRRKAAATGPASGPIPIADATPPPEAEKPKRRRTAPAPVADPVPPTSDEEAQPATGPDASPDGLLPGLPPPVRPPKRRRSRMMGFG